MKNIIAYIFCFALAMTTRCKTEEPEPEVVIITSDFYFEATINGKRLVMQEGIDNFQSEAGSSCSLTSCGCCDTDQYSGLGTSEKFLEGATPKLEFVHLWFHHPFDHEPAGSEISTMFRLGSYRYHDSDGVVIRLMDSNGQLWGSDAGDNSNASLKVVNISDNVVVHGIYQLHKIIEVEITCTLYPIQNNLHLPMPENPIKLENGTMKSRASVY